MSFLTVRVSSPARMQSVEQAESLQVSGNSPTDSSSTPVKRALSLTSPPPGCEASLTIEAALSLSLFLLMAAAIVQPMVWLDRQRKVQTVTEVLCGELSQYAYIERYLKGEDKILEELEQGEAALAAEGGSISGEAESISEAGGFWGEAAASLRLRGQIRKAAGDVRSLRIQNAQVPDEAGMICFELEYRELVPFFPIAGREITMTAAAQRRAWIGLDGKLGRADGNKWEDQEQDIIVYIGASMGRYHRNRDCHYISNQYESVSADRIAELRNSSGRKYKACASCSREGLAERVYITSNGEHYHTVKDCKSMIFYVRAVPLREVAHLGACSYCSK